MTMRGCRPQRLLNSIHLIHSSNEFRFTRRSAWKRLLGVPLMTAHSLPSESGAMCSIDQTAAAPSVRRTELTLFGLARSHGLISFLLQRPFHRFKRAQRDILLLSYPTSRYPDGGWPFRFGYIQRGERSTKRGNRLLVRLYGVFIQVVHADCAS